MPGPTLHVLHQQVMGLCRALAMPSQQVPLPGVRETMVVLGWVSLGKSREQGGGGVGGGGWEGGRRVFLSQEQPVQKHRGLKVGSVMGEGSHRI